MTQENKDAQWEDEFLFFTDTEKAREYCFGNYNNATRDEQVGLFCYLEACRKRQEELNHWNEVHGRIVAGMNEEKKAIVKSLREEITSLKKELEELRGQNCTPSVNEENIKLRQFIERAREFSEDYGASANGVCDCDKCKWLKEAELILK